MKRFSCLVVTPAQRLFSDEVTYAEVPGSLGYFGVLAGHEPFMALNADGGIVTIQLDDDGKDKRRFLVYEGITQVMDDVLTIACTHGVQIDGLSEEEVEKIRAEYESK